MKKRPAIAILIAAFSLVYYITCGPVFGASRDKPVDQKTFNAFMNSQYPSGKGPSSTSSARGFYKGTGGNWKRR